MHKEGPVIVIDDDEDDRDFFKTTFESLDFPNELMLFEKAEDALSYISMPEIRPFVIICDVNMPSMSGLQLRDALFEKPALKEKAIPFMFFTTAANKGMVKAAYELPVQGVFEKPTSAQTLRNRISMMINHWNESMLL